MTPLGAVPDVALGPGERPDVLVDGDVVGRLVEGDGLGGLSGWTVRFVPAPLRAGRPDQAELAQLALGKIEPKPSRKAWLDEARQAVTHLNKRRRR